MIFVYKTLACLVHGDGNSSVDLLRLYTSQDVRATSRSISRYHHNLTMSDSGKSTQTLNLIKNIHSLTPYTERKSSGYIDPNFPNPNGAWDTPIIIYGYRPAFSLALFAAIWFALFFAVHLFQTVRRRSWYFLTFPIGLVFEVVGYIARSLSAQKDPYHLLYFILNYFFIVTAPVFLAAGVYTVLSALIERVGGRYSVVRPRVILWFFVVSDVIATGVQVTGAALIGVRESNKQDPTTANNILLGGLAYQVFSLAVFVILTASIFVRARHALRSLGLTTFSAAFAVVTVLIYLRTCFRLAETAEGLGGRLSTHEAYFACLEFAPVAAAVLVFAIWFPGRCVGRRVKGEGSGEEGGEGGKEVPRAF